MTQIQTTILSTILIILVIPILGLIIRGIELTLIKITGPRLGMLIDNWLTIPGVVHHELAHAIVAFITGAKVLKIQLFNPNGNSLGSVTFRPRGFIVLRSVQLTLASVAPVIFGITSMLGLIYFGIPWASGSFLKILLIVYLLISILFHTTMSKPDIQNALKGLPICSILIFIICYFTKFNALLFIKDILFNLFVN